MGECMLSLLWGADMAVISSPHQPMGHVVLANWQCLQALAEVRSQPMSHWLAHHHGIKGW